MRRAAGSRGVRRIRLTSPIAETKQQTPIPSLEEFTTVGKPTKTIETPNGPVEIYDPTQDPEVIEEISSIYGNIDTIQPLDTTLSISSLARSIQALELHRKGCQIVLSSTCHPCIMKRVTIRNPSNLGQTYKRDVLLCDDQNFGNRKQFEIDGNTFIGCQIGEKDVPQMTHPYDAKFIKKLVNSLKRDDFTKFYFSQACQVWEKPAHN